MIIRLVTYAVLLGGVLLPVPASASCLSQTEQVNAIAAHRAISLITVKKALRRRTPAEVIGAHLCESSKGLQYRLTLYGRDGKVIRATVDAATGTVLSLK